MTMNHPLRSSELAVIGEQVGEAWCRLGAACAPNFAAVVARYAEPHRAYHTLAHVLECLSWLAASRELAERPFEVELALLYHDVVYDPGRVDNEARSADVFRDDARACGLPEAAASRIAALIESTAHQGGAPRDLRDADVALVHDIDLSILGASPHLFARYEAQIREEYRHVEEALFRAGRETVLRSFLETTSIYATPFFGQRLEAQARTNLGRSLAALRGAASARRG